METNQRASSRASDRKVPVMEPMEIEDAREMPGLARVDGGWRAWTYLAAASGLELLVWGLPTSYGVFLDHYLVLFPEESALLPQVGTISTGLMYLLLSPMALYLSNHPRQRKPTMWAGVVLLVAGLLGAAFSNKVWQLILTQGVLYAMGGVFLYCPVTSYMFEWWQKRRGMASGIIFAGTGAGGLIMPFIAAALLDRFGRRTTLISLAVSFGVLISVLVPFIRPRLPMPAKTARQSPRIDWTFLRGKAFWLLWIGVLIQGLGGFMPGTYLPAYATALHLPSTSGTLSLALMSFARVPGQVLIGYASDRVGPRKMILGVAGISALSVYAGWGSATNTGGLLAFALVFGGFAGSYTALYARFIEIVAKNDPHLPPIVYAMFCFARGIGNIASGPLSSALMTMPLHDAKGGYGVDGYGTLIVWTGATLTLSGVGAGYRGQTSLPLLATSPTTPLDASLPEFRAARRLMIKHEPTKAVNL